MVAISETIALPIFVVAIVIVMRSCRGLSRILLVHAEVVAELIPQDSISKPLRA